MRKLTAMKQCVRCRQLYADENLKFCRFDGTPLVNEAAPPDEAATILFTTGQLNNPVPRDQPRPTVTGKL